MNDWHKTEEINWPLFSSQNSRRTEGNETKKCVQIPSGLSIKLEFQKFRSLERVHFLMWIVSTITLEVSRRISNKKGLSNVGQARSALVVDYKIWSNTAGKILTQVNSSQDFKRTVLLVEREETYEMCWDLHPHLKPTNLKGPRANVAANARDMMQVHVLIQEGKKLLRRSTINRQPLKLQARIKEESSDTDVHVSSLHTVSVSNSWIIDLGDQTISLVNMEGFHLSLLTSGELKLVDESISVIAGTGVYKLTSTISLNSVIQVPFFSFKFTFN